MTRPDPGDPGAAARNREAERQRRLREQERRAAEAGPGGNVERPDPRNRTGSGPAAGDAPSNAAPPADAVGGSYPSEEPGFGEVLAGLFTPPAPTVIPTPYGDSYGAPGGTPAVLGAVVVGALGLGAWYLWKRGKA